MEDWKAEAERQKETADKLAEKIDRLWHKWQNVETARPGSRELSQAITELYEEFERSV